MDDKNTVTDKHQFGDRNFAAFEKFVGRTTFRFAAFFCFAFVFGFAACFFAFRQFASFAV